MRSILISVGPFHAVRVGVLGFAVLVATTTASAEQLVSVENMLRALGASSSGVLSTSSRELSAAVESVRSQESAPSMMPVPHAWVPRPEVDQAAFHKTGWASFASGAPSLMRAELMRAEIDSCERIDDVIWWLGPQEEALQTDSLPVLEDHRVSFTHDTLAAFTPRSSGQASRGSQWYEDAWLSNTVSVGDLLEVDLEDALLIVLAMVLFAVAAFPSCQSPPAGTSYGL